MSDIDPDLDTALDSCIIGFLAEDKKDIQCAYDKLQEEEKKVFISKLIISDTEAQQANLILDLIGANLLSGKGGLGFRRYLKRYVSGKYGYIY